VKLEIGKKYKIRNNEEVEYVEIIGVYRGPYRYDFKGTVVYKNGDTYSDIYMSDGRYWVSGNESSRDLIGEVNENRNW